MKGFDCVVSVFRSPDGLSPHLAEDLLLQLGLKPALGSLTFANQLEKLHKGPISCQDGTETQTLAIIPQKSDKMIGNDWPVVRDKNEIITVIIKIPALSKFFGTQNMS